MKPLLLLALLVAASPAAVAKTQLAGKNVSSGTGAPQTRTSRSVTVFGDGSVQIDVNQHGKQSSSKATLGRGFVAQLSACSKEVAKARKLGANHCAGGAFTGYMLGDNLFSRTACGQKQTVKSPCVPGALKILDSL